MVLIVYVPIAERLNRKRRRSILPALVTSTAITVMVVTSPAVTSPTTASISPSPGHLLAVIPTVQAARVDHPDVGVRRPTDAGLLLVQRGRIQRDGRRRYAVQYLGRVDLVHERWRRNDAGPVRTGPVGQQLGRPVDTTVAVGHYDDAVVAVARDRTVRHGGAERDGRLYAGWRLLGRVQRDQLVDLDWRDVRRYSQTLT